MQLESAKMISELVDMKQDKEEKNDKSGIVLATDMPFELFKKIKKKGKIGESYDFGEINYKKMLFHEGEKTFVRQKQLSSRKLPTKLFNIKRYSPEKTLVDKIINEVVELTAGRTDVKNYAILSYVCGPYFCSKHKNCYECKE